MDKLKYKILTGIIFMCLILPLVSACGQEGNASASDALFEVNFAELEIWAQKYVKEHFSLTADELTDYEVTMEKIYYGDFTRSGVGEAFVFCRTHGLPHAAGGDTSIGILLSADTSEVLLFQEFHGDEVNIGCLEGGVLLLTETTTYQGLSTQRRYLLAYRDGAWGEFPIEVETGVEENGERIYRSLDREGGAEFCFLTGKTLILTYNKRMSARLADAGEITGLYIWSGDGKFNIVKQDNPNRPY